MSVRAKFVVSSKIAEHVSPDSMSYRLALRPVVSGSKENEAFYKYTPGGSLTLETVNQAVFDQLKIGKEYFIDITPAEKPPAS